MFRGIKSSIINQNEARVNLDRRKPFAVGSRMPIRDDNANNPIPANPSAVNAPRTNPMPGELNADWIMTTSGSGMNTKAVITATADTASK